MQAYNKTNIEINTAPKLRLTPMIPQHLKLIQKWGVHEDLLLLDYNISRLSMIELKLWYSYRKKSIKTRYFSVFNEENIMVGYVGLKDLNIFKKTGFLGIAFDPNFLGLGLGTEALGLLLEYYFMEMKYKTLFLEVNAFNKRAIKLYQNAGFKNEGEFIVEFEVPLERLRGLEIIDDKEYFIQNHGKLYSRVLRMRLDRYQYIK